MGVPTVAVVTEAFKEQCENTRYEQGFPTQRLFFCPMPIAGTTNEYNYQVVRGNDPITGKPLFQEIVDGLTIDNPDDQKTGEIITQRPETYGPDTPDNLNQLLMDKKYTDFLPVVLPTLSKVNDMLKGTTHDRDEVIGQMKSSGYWRNRTYTVEMVASAAVMAGCKPSYLPVLVCSSRRTG